MFFFIIPIIAAIVGFQLFFGISCAKHYPSTRLPASLLIVVTPLQLVAATFGEKFRIALNGQSSFDALKDAFEILFQSICLVVALAVLSGMLCIWVVFSIRNADVATDRLK